MSVQVMVLAAVPIIVHVLQIMLDHNAPSQFVTERMPQTLQTFAQVMVHVPHQTTAHAAMATLDLIALHQFAMELLLLMHQFALVTESVLLQILVFVKQMHTLDFNAVFQFASQLTVQIRLMSATTTVLASLIILAAAQVDGLPRTVQFQFVSV
mgnify:CR=1 FL=1